MSSIIDKEKIILKYRKNEKDSGSSEVQVAFLTEKINNLMLHLKKHRKDYHSLRGMIILINQRKSSLKYIKKRDLSVYQSLIADLKLRK